MADGKVDGAMGVKPDGAATMQIFHLRSGVGAELGIALTVGAKLGAAILVSVKDEKYFDGDNDGAIDDPGELFG